MGQVRHRASSMKTLVVAMMVGMMLVGRPAPLHAASCARPEACGGPDLRPLFKNNSNNGTAIIAGAVVGTILVVGLVVWIAKTASSRDLARAPMTWPGDQQERSDGTPRYGLHCPQDVKSFTGVCW